MCRRHSAFTLLEMSIVLVIIAVMMAGGAVTFSTSFQQRQYDDVKNKMAVLQKALLDYRRTFNRLPCPADIAGANVSDGTFGVEAQNPVGCSGTPSATYITNLTTGTSTACTAGQRCIYGGMVPTKTLRLPDEYAFDSWGRRIFYAVDSDYALVDAFTTLSSLADATARITVQTTDGTSQTTSAAYVLLSYGPNGHGSFPRYISAAADFIQVAEITKSRSYQVASISSSQMAQPGQQTMSDWQVSTLAPPAYTLAAGGGGGSSGLGGGSGGPGNNADSYRTATGSTNAGEQENCDCNTTASGGTFDNTFVQGPYTKASPTNTFDDIVVYGTRANLRSALE